MIETEFEETIIMSTYLIALIISDFKCKHGVARAGVTGTVDVKVCARPSAFNQLDYALKHTVLTLEMFEKYFGIKYNLSKLDHVAIPDLSFRKFKSTLNKLISMFYLKMLWKIGD
jgi:aminopeptidase N